MNQTFTGLTTPTIHLTVTFTNMSVSYLNPLPFIYNERNGQSQKNEFCFISVLQFNHCSYYLLRIRLYCAKCISKVFQKCCFIHWPSYLLSLLHFYNVMVWIFNVVRYKSYSTKFWKSSSREQDILSI